MKSTFLFPVVLVLGVSACSPDPPTSAPAQAQRQDSLIQLGPNGEISTPQVTVDAAGGVTVPGLGAMRFDPNGDIYGSDGTKLYDGVANRWSAQADRPANLVGVLNALTKGFTYAGREFRREAVTRFSYDASLRLLGIAVDDADETAPITALLRLQEVALVEETFSRGSVVTEGILLTCTSEHQDCISVTFDSFAEASAALRTGPSARLSGAKRRNVFGFGCKPDRCKGIYQALAELSK